MKGLVRFMEKGCVHIYHGDGKGKTTSGVGLCVRAAGAGLKVLIYQFLKDNSSSERKVLQNIPGITVVDGNEKVKFTFNMTNEEKKLASMQCTFAFEMIINMAVRDGYDVVFFDEILHLIHKQMIDEDMVLNFLKNRPKGMEVILTGYYPSERLVAAADYVSHICKEKHPYDQKLPARLGIEM